MKILESEKDKDNFFDDFISKFSDFISTLDLDQLKIYLEIH